MGLQIAHRIAASPVHGLGLFSLAPLAAGTVLWRFEPGLDDALRLDSLTPSRRLELLHYGYTNPARPGWVIVCGDGAKYWNFPRPGEAANAVLSGLTEHGEHLVIAAQAIRQGEELLIEAASDADYIRKLSHLLAPGPVVAVRPMAGWGNEQHFHQQHHKGTTERGRGPRAAGPG